MADPLDTFEERFGDLAAEPDVVVPPDEGGTFDGFFDELGALFGGAADAVSSTAFSLEASIEAALTGVTQADVAAGRVDVSKLSREQRAQLRLDGSTGGPIPNPWTVLVDLSPVDVARLTGGGVLVFDVTTNAALALVDSLAPPRFALLWDDDVIESRGSIPTAVFGTSTLAAEVGRPRGKRLTLWTDATLAANLRKIEPPGSLARVLAELKAEKGEEENPFAAAIDKFLNVQLGVGLAVVVVVGVAVVLLIESGQLSKTAQALRPGL